MNPKTIIVLVGEAASGKSHTLREMVNQHCTSHVGRVYSTNGKRLFLARSSPQEYQKCKFCDSDWVVKKIEVWIQECEANGCVLLIMPFQIHCKRNTAKLNEDCIREPIKELKARNFRVHVVYLRKDGSRKLSPRLDDIDTMIQPLEDDEIESRDGDTKRQAKELWNIVTKVDP